VTLQQSILGSGVIAHVPHAGTDGTATVERISIAFPSSLLVLFNALYTWLRILAGGSPWS
jgi:hypothetical protein